MGKPLDLSSLTRAERLVLASGALSLVNGIVPWWFRIHTMRRVYFHNAGLSSLSVVAVVAGALAGIAVLARAAIWPEPAPARDGAVYAGLGVIALVALVGEFARARSAWLGLYVGIAIAGALIFAGLRRRAERRAGWT